jgi:hypothetical protein
MPKLDRTQLLSILIMVGATRRDVHALQADQLPVLGVTGGPVIENVREAEEKLVVAERLIRNVLRSAFPEVELPWESE